MKKKNWYKLDSVGKFYASISSKEIPNVFRYSCLIKDEINEEDLQIALNNTVIIYPNFNVNLKKGLFWYYLDETKKEVKVTKENIPICFRLYNSDDDFLYRVSYYKNKINFEVSHILSDGRGSIEFFKVLISNYIKIHYNLNNYNVTTNNSCLEKSEDSFLKYYKKTPRYNRKRPKIYKYNGKKVKNTRFMECHMSTNKLLELAHKYNATLTEFLVSLLIYAFKDELKEKDYNKSIKIDIPVDLRTFFRSTSSKNFFGLTFVAYKFKSHEDTLESIIKEIKKQFKENITKEKLSERANLMVSFEKNLFCRIIPIFLKNYVLKIINHFTAQMCTSCLSNIGKVKFDNDINPYINSLSVLTSTSGFQFTICSFLNDISIGVSSVYKYNDVIKNFFRFLSENNLDMVIDFNGDE